jgi:hypothetical protein
MPVHHVEMDPVGACRVHGADFFAHLAKSAARIDGAMIRGRDANCWDMCAFPNLFEGAERSRVTWGRAGGNALADVSCGRKNLPERAAIAGLRGSGWMRESPVLLGFSAWHGAC